MKIPATPPDHIALLSRLGKDPAKARALATVLSTTQSGPLDPWEKVRFRPPEPPLSPAEMWAALKLARLGARRTLSFEDKQGRPFHFTERSDFARALHEIDSNARGFVGMPAAAASAATPKDRDVYLRRSLIEEPFSSSLLEGAATTREIARKMIEDGREPKTVGERMVLNNYRAMAFIREHGGEPLTPARILDLHRILTEETLERPEMVGVLRRTGDDVRVVESVTGDTLHIPPDARALSQRLERLCDFANAPSSGKDGFLHPVIHAIVLHFMLAYDHPFWDGNGRCARALFYWCVLRHGYWLLEYVSISAVIRRAPTRYGMAFLHSEIDEGDLGYFVEHQLGVVERALADLRKYLDAKAAERGTLARAMGALETRLNPRQWTFVQEALKRPGAAYGIAGHAERFSVSYLTARADLEDLWKLKLLRKTRKGVQSVYLVPKDLRARLERRADG